MGSRQEAEVERPAVTRVELFSNPHLVAESVGERREKLLVAKGWRSARFGHRLHRHNWGNFRELQVLYLPNIKLTCMIMVYTPKQTMDFLICKRQWSAWSDYGLAEWKDERKWENSNERLKWSERKEWRGKFRWRETKWGKPAKIGVIRQVETERTSTIREENGEYEASTRNQQKTMDLVLQGIAEWSRIFL